MSTTKVDNITWMLTNTIVHAQSWQGRDGLHPKMMIVVGQLWKRPVANTFQNLCTANAVFWSEKKMHTTIDATHADCDFQSTTLHLPRYLNFCLLRLSAAAFCASLMVSSSLGPSVAINIFHQCPVRSRPFPGTGRFLAGLFTFWVGSELAEAGAKLSLLLVLRRGNLYPRRRSEIRGAF